MWPSSHKFFSLHKLPSIAVIQMSRVFCGRVGWYQDKSKYLGILDSSYQNSWCKASNHNGFSLPSLSPLVLAQHCILGNGDCLSQNLGRSREPGCDVRSTSLETLTPSCRDWTPHRREPEEKLGSLRPFTVSSQPSLFLDQGMWKSGT
jgi:hypothetical protein